MKTIASLLTLAALTAGCGQATRSTPTGPNVDPGTAVPGSPAPDVPISDETDPAGRVMTPSMPTWVTPHPGGGPLMPVTPSGLRVGTRGGSPFAVVRWWSAIAPCYVLRSVNVGVSDTTVRLRLVEGSDDPNAACAEVAMLKATRVDLGGLAPGTYTVVAGGRHRTLTI
jgi:hypothetical protein